MKHAVAVLATGFALLATPARGAVTFDFLFDGGFPLAVSNDGSVVAGNLSNGGFGPFRWTQATGPASLGRVTHVGGGGIPGISADGTRVASSIASLDSSYTTQGLWTLGSGWQELSPFPPDGYNQDGTFGNVYGLSGDGNTVVGLYPRAGGRAHASKWTQATGVVDLGGTLNMQASRANGVNFDASVIVGWVETPTGPWRPAAWVDGSLVLLTNYDNSGTTIALTGEARAVTQAGDIIVGFMSDSASGQRAATMWKRTGGVFGAPQVLGWVDGTTPGYGINSPYSVSSDGKLVVGYCSYDGDPFSTTGFVWTEATGVIGVNTFLANNGVYVDPNFTIASLTAMTPDGTQIFGYGQTLTPPYTRRAFRITVPKVAAVPSAAPVARLRLSAPKPNPSSATARVEFTLADAAPVDLSVFDAAGRHVATLLHSDLQPGSGSGTWDGRDASGQRASAGLYFVRMSTPGGVVSQRLAHVR